ncbi:hypothetical protein [Metabacillus litoralis]|uniref:hypothetical protein n=1 Tax=Metabacillus litoralis TaxID=152268 RepID=UPI001CFDF87F|nr:hypothetical protein [Metabacillus litoralis]
MNDNKKVELIQKISNDIIRMSVKDRQGKSMSEHEKTIELLARAMCDFSVMYLSPESNHEEILKGTLAKVKIAYNTIEESKKPSVIIKRI